MLYEMPGGAGIECVCERPPVDVAVATLHAPVVLRALSAHFKVLWRCPWLFERLHSLDASIGAVLLCRSFDAFVIATPRSCSVALITLAPLLTVQLRCT